MKPFGDHAEVRIGDQGNAPSVELEEEYDVVVVGLGPVGAVAACWLGKGGLRTLVVDKSTTIWQIPRAVAIDHEIMRVLQNLGVADQVLPFTAPFPASEHFGAQGQLIRRIDAVQPPFPLGYTPTMVFTQPAMEAVLRSHVETFPTVTVKLGLEVKALAQDQRYVTVTISSADGTEQNVRSRYVLGCDGASSTVRKLVGIKLNDLIFDEPWLVVDVRVSEQGLAKLPVTAAQYCNPERPTTFIVGPGDHRRWEIMLSPREDAREMEKEENVWRLLSPWLAPSDGTLWRASSYRFHALLAERWSVGRVFIAGDAAHQQPPFIGQGMCQGIRDVCNFCWKLEEVLSGTADPALLDTYEVERGRHVQTLTSRIKAIGHHICERDPDAARRRDDALLKQGGGQAPTITRQEIVPPLESGLLSDSPHPANGTLFPQPWIQTSEGFARMDTLAGYGWRLVVDGRIAPDVSSIEILLDGLPIGVVSISGNGLQERDGICAAWFDGFGCVAAIVRPDHYVFGVVREFTQLPEVLVPLRSLLRSQAC